MLGYSKSNFTFEVGVALTGVEVAHFEVGVARATPTVT